MKNTRNYLLLLYISMIVAIIASCKADTGNHVPISADKTKPGVITNIKIDNYNGGAFITYTLPNSDNILYVLAKYQIRNGVSRETKSSYYTDTVNVEGFAKEADYDVTLYTVSRADVMSDPVKVTVHPTIPPYISIKASTTVQTDFGGVNVQALNPLKKEIGIIITAYDKSTGLMEVQDQHYTKADTINYSLRGYNTDPRQFGIYVTDNFGNISDTLKQTITPLFEELLDKSQFSVYNLPSDTPIGYGWVLPNFWDGKTDGSSAGWHTNPGNNPPFVGTFNVGTSYKLSRFILWERPDDGSDKYAFGHGNPRLFTLWGSNVASPKDVQLPVSSAVGTVLGDWVNIGNFTYPNPPSGLPPLAHNAADNAFVLAGVNFNISLAAPPVHFIRFATSQSWSGGNFAHAMEISLYGKPQ
ncbi:DUF4959 domain-containing protein [Mucilaginibacter sp. FT3.2]|uniref:DUF4959 domain-containing protein n=1 Tax=Mucilaginibacter sp. FT3.2 TaxID=2723090 RepID=UPI0016080A52|nr:DUF4959 domain-containing protein [Mucilaginibacter sp. FT3.2]MBB6230286.1 hypothetical protein [Mucilaginibacter sp. FT3.2]